MINMNRNSLRECKIIKFFNIFFMKNKIKQHQIQLWTIQWIDDVSKKEEIYKIIYSEKRKT